MKKLDKIVNWLAGVSASWLLVCFLVYFITLCFDITFTWRIGTGIWLSTVLLKFTFDTKK